MSLFHNDALIGAAGKGSGAASYQVQRSLRFNSSDSAFCSRVPSTAGNSKTWTWAGWVKRSSLNSSGGTYQQLFTAGSSVTVRDVFFFDQDVADTLAFYSVGSGFGGGVLLFRTNAVFRDSSAWYHIVLAVDSTQATAANRIKLYVNGVQQTFSTANYPSQNSDGLINSTNGHAIGRDQGQAAQYLNGLLADIHFCDGTAYDASAFGEFDANGIWQPKKFAGVYGTNGFKLSFSDNSTAAALGTDTSGAGNHWTPNNLSVLQGTGNYVPAMSSSGSLTFGTTFLNGFDGNTSTAVYGSAGGTMTFSPSPGIAYASKVEVITTGDANSQASLNGASAIGTPNNTWTTLATGSGTISSIVFSDTAGGEPGFAAIRVDNVILVDYRAGSGNDSLVDVPTNGAQTDTGAGGEVRGNYCTLNPLDNGPYPSAITISNGNLEQVASGETLSATKGTVSVSSGKWYWEVTVDTLSSGGVSPRVGIITTNTVQTYQGGGSNEWIMYMTSYAGYGGRVNNGASLVGSDNLFANGDVGMFAVDMDNKKLFCGKNGVWANSGNPVAGTGFFFDNLPSSVAPLVNTGYSSKVTANFGQRPFAYTAPSGFKALNTANLPAPLVTKPSTVMDVKLYTGNGSTQTISTDFSPDFLWFKARGDSGQHALYDIVRGASKSLVSNSTASEATEGGGLSSFDSAGFSLSGDNTVQGSTNGSGRSYVAWAWDAGSSTVTNTQGSISSQVRANASAGFSIVTFTMGSGSYTVGHGLGVAPTLLITKARSNSSSWWTYHTSLGTGSYLALNSTAAAASDYSWGSAPTSTVFTANNNFFTNGYTYVVYAFAPVAGYSSAFSYSGNGSSDGPMVYLGFRPALIILKRTDSANDWGIFDNKRLGYNPQTAFLFPNASYSESASDYMDLLSNGFKIRRTNAEYNASGGTYVGFAWAESPFQYARAR